MRQAWPQARITLVGLPWAKTFVERFAQYIDSFQEFPGFDGIPERGFDVARMQAFAESGSAVDIAIQLHGDGSVTNRFLSRLRPRLTAGFFPPGQTCPDPVRFIPYPDADHEVRRLLRLMQHLGMPLTGEDLEFPLTHRDHHEAYQIIAAEGLSAGRFVCLHPGARDPKRRWPLEDFLEVGRVLAARGLRVVLTGTGEEADQTRILRERLGQPCLDLAGKTSLGGLGALVKRARLLISNDTGISHIAAALRVPSIIVFSASDPRRWAPLDTDRHRALGDPFASPAMKATPASVLHEASRLLVESPLHVEARGGGFPVLPAVNWTRVKRVLLINEGPEADVILLGPCLSALRSQTSSFALLTSQAGARVAALLPGIDRLVVADRASLVEPVADGAVRKLVDRLRTSSFEAAIIFTRPNQSPYTAAYLCYLAGIPVRIAASKEFGGALLSHWVRKLPEGLDAQERHLALLRAVELPWQAREPGVAVPLAVEARTRGKLREAGVDPSDGFVLLHDVEGSVETAERVRDVTGMKVMLGFQADSPVDDAGLVQLSDLVITGNPLIARLADAFGRPIIATAGAATPSDGWRPRRSFSKLLTCPGVSQDDVLQAVRTLLIFYETTTSDPDLACPR